MIQKIFLIATLLLPFSSVHAQVAAAARTIPGKLSVGGEYSNFDPDFGPKRLNGAGFYIDYHLTPWIGAEGEGKFLRLSEFKGEHEESYLAGPHINFMKFGPIQPFAKVLFGIGKITYPYSYGYGTYFAYAPGGGVDYHLTRRISVRGEYEYQIWPGAPGTAFLDISPNHGLTPHGFSVGAAYRIF